MANCFMRLSLPRFPQFNDYHQSQCASDDRLAKAAGYHCRVVVVAHRINPVAVEGKDLYEMPLFFLYEEK